MIDEIDKELTKWIKSALGNVEVRLGPPGQGSDGEFVSLYLLEIQPASPSGHDGSRFFQLSLHYLITTWAPEPETAHRMLGELAFRAAEHPDFQLGLEPLEAQLWSAFGTAPRPGFLLRVPLRRQREKPHQDIVRHPLVLRETSLGTMEGVLLGPGEVPVAGACVELVGLGRKAYTDGHGRFVFSAVPAEPGRKRLRIRAKGRELAVYAEAGLSEPFLIHVDFKEV